MKKVVALIAVVALFFLCSSTNAQTTNPTQPIQHGQNFVDKNGDGYNDNAPDHDGDGIPNGVDPDYKGPKLQKNKFVDLNGDGINDNAGKGRRGGKGGKGIHAPGTGKQNGAAAGTGDCTQTGTGTQNGAGRGYRGGK